jgi:hypothetical protein
MIATLDTGPPNQGALAVTSRKGRRKTIDAGSDASESIIAQGRRFTQLSRICRPLVAVWKALDWGEWEKLRERCAERRSA